MFAFLLVVLPHSRTKIRTLRTCWSISLRMSSYFHSGKTSKTHDDGGTVFAHTLLSFSSAWLKQKLSPWLRNSSILSLKGCRFSSEDSLRTFSVSAEHAETEGGSGSRRNTFRTVRTLQGCSGSRVTGKRTLCETVKVKGSACSAKEWRRKEKGKIYVDVWLSCFEICINIYTCDIIRHHPWIREPGEWNWT